MTSILSTTLDRFETEFPRPTSKLLQAAEDIRARRYRSITFTEDGTVIIVDAETGISASGASRAEAEASFAGKVSA